MLWCVVKFSFFLVCTCVAWVCLVCLLLCKAERSFAVYLQLLRGWIWACMRCHCLCLCWGLDGNYVSELPYVLYYVGVKSSFQHASPRGPMCFWCLMFSLLGPCELLFLICFIASWT